MRLVNKAPAEGRRDRAGSHNNEDSLEFDALVLVVGDFGAKFVCAFLEVAALVANGASINFATEVMQTLSLICVPVL